MDIDGVEDPFPSRPREEITEEVVAARRNVIDKLADLLLSLEELTAIDAGCVVHPDHWGIVMPLAGITFEWDVHQAPNVIAMTAQVPMDNIIAQMRAEEENRDG